MDQLDVFDDFILSMSERTKTFVVTFFDIFGIKLTEFGFIAIGVVQLFEFVVGKLAKFVGALFLFTKEMAVGDIGRATLILFIMIVQASLAFMWVICFIKNVLFL